MADTIEGPDSDSAAPLSDAGKPVKLRQPPGLWCLFIVEMWERFSYYGMRAILVLYLVAEWGPNMANPGRDWTDVDASHLYGYYTGLVYLTPILGGLVADRLIGTHRSMVAGSLLIAMGHVTLAISGFGEWASNHTGMSIFIMGLALIILGTGHFKPCVSVMVGQLYEEHDPRRDGGFTIFYMGINVGAFLAPLVCGFLGESERFGWHWGFGAAAVGMILGLFTYLFVRPIYLKGIGDPPEGKRNTMPLFIFGSIILAAIIGLLYFFDVFEAFGEALESLTKVIPALYLTLGGIVLIIALAVWFIAAQEPGEKGQVFTVLCFIIFNAVFWLAFEQAGSSLTLFAERDTQRVFEMPEWIVRACNEPGFPLHFAWWIVIGVLLWLPWIHRMTLAPRKEHRNVWATVALWVVAVLGVNLIWLGIHKAIHPIEWLADFSEMPASWFQTINPFLIVALAPLYSIMWGWLGRRNQNPTQSLKIAYGLILLGAGYVFMVAGGMQAAGGIKVGIFWLAAAYFLHTTGELCLSPTGLSFVTKASPAKLISFIMGLWFLSSVVANFGGGLVAGTVTLMEAGQIEITSPDGGRLAVLDRVGGNDRTLAVSGGVNGDQTAISLGILNVDGVSRDDFDGELIARAGYRPPASTIGQVITFINDAPGNDGKVVAALSEDGRALTLTDTTDGQGTLKIEAQAGSHTASDLGITEPAVGAVVSGRDLFEELDVRDFAADIKLSELSAGEGIDIGDQEVHLLIQTADGTEIAIDLGEMTNGSAVKPAVATLGDVVDRINDAPDNDGRITAAIAEDGRSLWVLDKAGGEGTFTIADAPGSQAATDLGIAGNPRGESPNVIQGTPLLSEADFSRFRDYSELDALNEGEGVRVRHDEVDFRITARDGTVIDINLGCVNGISKDTPLAELNGGDGVVIDDDPETPDITFIGRDEVTYDVDLTGATTFGDLTLAVSDGTGKISPFWNSWGIKFAGKGDFFFLFVFSAAVAALLVLILTPIFKRMLHGVE